MEKGCKVKRRDRIEDEFEQEDEDDFISAGRFHCLKMLDVLTV